MHKVVVLALEQVIPFDVATPCEVFGRVSDEASQRYQIVVCGESSMLRAGAFDLAVRSTLRELENADTVIVAGVEDPMRPVSSAVVSALTAAANRGTRVASICSGAFVLAQAGLIDGKRATTHWKAIELLAKTFPAVNVVDNVLFTDNGQVLTSAGAAAGIDLCLHLVRQDYGVSVAEEAARLAVVSLRREGAQPQFLAQRQPDGERSLQDLLVWILANLKQELSLKRLAEAGGMSVRTLNRRFIEHTSLSPAQWLLRARVQEAQRLLETTSLPVERVAAEAGFGSGTALRSHFARCVGRPPTHYRRVHSGRVD